MNGQAISYGYDVLRFARPVEIGYTLSIYEEVTDVGGNDDERGRVVKQYEAAIRTPRQRRWPSTFSS